METDWKLPGVLVVVFIAVGVLAALMLLIMSKRQIQRLAFRGQKGLHRPVGYRADKRLRRRIESRLDRCRDLFVVPTLVHPSLHSCQPNFHRIMTLELARILEAEVAGCVGVFRQRGETLRRYLISTRPHVLAAVPVRTLHLYCDIYESARYSAEVFTESHFNQISRLHHEILDNLCFSRQVEPQSPISSSLPRVNSRCRPQTLTPLVSSPLRRETPL